MPKDAGCGIVLFMSTAWNDVLHYDIAIRLAMTRAQTEAICYGAQPFCAVSGPSDDLGILIEE